MFEELADLSEADSFLQSDEQIEKQPVIDDKMFDQMMYDGLQRKNEKLRGKLDAQVTKYRDLEGVYAELQECICELEA